MAFVPVERGADADAVAAYTLLLWFKCSTPYNVAVCEWVCAYDDGVRHCLPSL